jgi:hypothetical protein
VELYLHSAMRVHVVVLIKHRGMGWPKIYVTAKFMLVSKSTVISVFKKKHVKKYINMSATRWIESGRSSRRETGRGGGGGEG